MFGGIRTCCHSVLSLTPSETPSPADALALGPALAPSPAARCSSAWLVTLAGLPGHGRYSQVWRPLTFRLQAVRPDAFAPDVGAAALAEFGSARPAALQYFAAVQSRLP